MLFALAQDRAELMAFDTSTGEEIKLKPGAEMHPDLEWKSMLHLLGPVNDELVIAGASKSFELRLRDETGLCFRANYLIASACRGAGRGVVTEDYAYLPVMGEDDNSPLGGLGVYDVRTWKVVERPSWKEPNEFGNLLVAFAIVLVIAAVLRSSRLAISAVVVVIAKLGLERVVKQFVERERPGTSIGITEIHRHGNVPASGLSFVSGHAVITAAMATILMPYLPRRWRWVPWVFVALNGIARIYVGAHNPLDIVGGVGLGLFIGGVVNFFLAPTEARV
jgi:undecaprenyl-diphosphatase